MLEAVPDLGLELPYPLLITDVTLTRGLFQCQLDYVGDVFGIAGGRNLKKSADGCGGVLGVFSYCCHETPPIPLDHESRRRPA